MGSADAAALGRRQACVGISAQSRAVFRGESGGSAFLSRALSSLWISDHVQLAHLIEPPIGLIQAAIRRFMLAKARSLRSILPKMRRIEQSRCSDSPRPRSASPALSSMIVQSLLSFCTANESQIGISAWHARGSFLDDTTHRGLSEPPRPGCAAACRRSQGPCPLSWPLERSQSCEATQSLQT